MNEQAVRRWTGAFGLAIVAINWVIFPLQIWLLIIGVMLIPTREAAVTPAPKARSRRDEG